MPELQVPYLRELPYNWRVTDGNGCSTPGTWNVIQPEQIVPGITTSNSPICLGATLNLTTSNATGGTPPYRYSWTGPNGFTANNTQNPTILNATTAASGTYTLTVTDANNCFKTTTTVVTVHPATTMDDPANQPVCHNTLTDAVNFTGATSYTWTNNNTTIGLAASGSDNIPAFIATNTGTTPVTATITVTPTANGCPGVVQTFTITVNPVPVVQITNNTPVLCDDGVTSIVLSSNVAGTTYSWTASRTSGTTTGFSNGNGTSIIQTLTGAGIVQYVITPSANGCTGASSTVTIEVISSDFDLDVNVSGSNPELLLLSQLHVQLI
ncbi:MAG: hypothetical protein IPF54_03500 [Draconibacterium sp.]|nr:hypothetical protein [Draconibacterium sp.]